MNEWMNEWMLGFIMFTPGISHELPNHEQPRTITQGYAWNGSKTKMTEWWRGHWRWLILSMSPLLHRVSDKIMQWIQLFYLQREH